MKAQFDKGYKLFIDNGGTSEVTLSYLYSKKTGARRTARKNRLKLPPSPSTRKESIYALRRKYDILHVRLQYKKEDYFLSTMLKENNEKTKN